MADVQRRELERAAARGDLDAATALLRLRMRVGDLGPEGARLAAYLGYEPAVRLYGSAGFSQGDDRSWLNGLSSWGRAVSTQAALALSAQVEPRDEVVLERIARDPSTDTTRTLDTWPLVRGGTNRIGRRPGVEIQVDDGGVSKVHCLIFSDPNDGAVRVRDLDSRNGTLLGGEPVLEDTLFSVGETLQVGQSEFRLRSRPRATSSAWQSFFEAVQTWLDDPSEAHEKAINAAHARVPAPRQPEPPETARTRSVSSAVFSAISDHPPQPGRALGSTASLSNLRLEIRRPVCAMLLPWALASTPLPTVPAALQETGLVVARHRDNPWRDWVTSARDELGLQLFHRLPPDREIPLGINPPDVVILAEASGRREALTLLGSPRTSPRAGWTDVRHPCLATVRSHGLLDSSRWRYAHYVREDYVEGSEPLLRWCARSGPDPRRCAKLVADLCPALDLVLPLLDTAALDPSRVVVRAGGQPVLIGLLTKDLQFDLPKLLMEPAGLGYLAPERLPAPGGTLDDLRAGAATGDRRRWAVRRLGLLLYELIVGRPAYPPLGVDAMLEAIREREPAPPSELGVAVPPALESVLLRALARAPGERYAAPSELEVALRGAL